jgi:hypothetical protein
LTSTDTPLLFPSPRALHIDLDNFRTRLLPGL